MTTSTGNGSGTLAEDRLLRAAVRALSARKAEHPVVLDLRGHDAFTEYFVICHGTSERQVKSLADAVEDQVREEAGRKPSTEGYARGEWILLDYGEVVVHLFLEDAREFYRLEALWGDCPQIDVATFGE
jgi:ribosome-associated protein